MIRMIAKTFIIAARYWEAVPRGIIQNMIPNTYQTYLFNPHLLQEVEGLVVLDYTTSN